MVKKWVTSFLMGVWIFNTISPIYGEEAGAFMSPGIEEASSLPAASSSAKPFISFVVKEKALERTLSFSILKKEREKFLKSFQNSLEEQSPFEKERKGTPFARAMADEVRLMAKILPKNNETQQRAWNLELKKFGLIWCVIGSFTVASLFALKIADTLSNLLPFEYKKGPFPPEDALDVYAFDPEKNLTYKLFYDVIKKGFRKTCKYFIRKAPSFYKAWDTLDLRTPRISLYPIDVISSANGPGGTLGLVCLYHPTDFLKVLSIQNQWKIFGGVTLATLLFVWSVIYFPIKAFSVFLKKQRISETSRFFNLLETVKNPQALQLLKRAYFLTTLREKVSFVSISLHNFPLSCHMKEEINEELNHIISQLEEMDL